LGALDAFVELLDARLGHAGADGPAPASVLGVVHVPGVTLEVAGALVQHAAGVIAWIVRPWRAGVPRQFGDGHGDARGVAVPQGVDQSLGQFPPWRFTLGVSGPRHVVQTLLGVVPVDDPRVAAEVL